MVATHLPRIVVAAPASGHGKTTISTGLMAALRARGLTVSGHKVGPDYIDPGYHALATGRPGRNLDPFMVGEERIVPLLLHGADGAEVAVIEGVMGLFDGRLGTSGESSTAEVAKLTSSPVVVVIDISHSSRTHAATVLGMMAFDPAVQIAGVILNKARTTRHATEVADALSTLDIPVLGVIPRDSGVEAPSRHLGLVPVAERRESSSTLDRLATVVTDYVDLDAIIDIAGSAAMIECPAWSALDEVTAPAPGTDARPVIAVAGGRAFTFRYAETDELLRAAGCVPIEFDPLVDAALPDGTAGIYLGGGFPEMYGTELAQNTPLLNAIADAVEGGMPTVAECAGLTYLASSIDGETTIGVLDGVAEMTPRLTLGYRTATSPHTNLLSTEGEQITGHEFHRTRLTPSAAAESTDLTPAWNLPAPEGFAGPTIHASYLHVHWAGHPQLAQRFADAAHRYARSERATPTEMRLGHHGDAEAHGGYIDFAVNVHPGPRPAWLTEALRAGIDEVHRYPENSEARSALAAAHGRAPGEVLPTAGVTEAFTLIARMRNWRRPTVIHPQFTEPHRALQAAGHTVSTVLCRPDDDFALHPDEVPSDADLVVVGNPTNPTGVLHSADTICRLLRPGRLVVVDEAFLDSIPGQPETLSATEHPGLVVCRSLTKLWSIPGIRVGYLLGEASVLSEIARQQSPWAVSNPALAALTVCTTDTAQAEQDSRSAQFETWRRHLSDQLTVCGVRHVRGRAPFILAQPGPGIHTALREQGIAVRRADTFPGLDDSWVRIAVREPASTRVLTVALDNALSRNDDIAPAM